MQKGATQFITEGDLPPIKTSDESSKLGDDLKRAMKTQFLSSLALFDSFFLFKPHSALWKALFVAYGGPYAVAAGLKITHDLLAFLQPQLLRWFLSYISAYQETRLDATERPSKFEGFLIALLMFVASVVQTIFLNQVSDMILCFGNSLFIPLIVFYTYIRDWNARSSWSCCCNLFESSRPFQRRAKSRLG